MAAEAAPRARPPARTRPSLNSHRARARSATPPRARPRDDGAPPRAAVEVFSACAAHSARPSSAAASWGMMLIDPDPGNKMLVSMVQFLMFQTLIFKTCVLACCLPPPTWITLGCAPSKPCAVGCTVNAFTVGGTANREWATVLTYGNSVLDPGRLRFPVALPCRVRSDRGRDCAVLYYASERPDVRTSSSVTGAKVHGV